ncbi:hypothetical protein KJ780_04900 [Candidatus Micrarchaeota archaeon]|nr:hypothetical protein [Candidatus Micrarchaeota archaeon]
MGIRKVVLYTIRGYRRNLWIITLLSIMFVASMFALFLSPAATYVSLGGSYIRTTSIPQMSTFDIIVVVAAYLISLFIFADALTNINLIIKANRTVSKIPSEILSGVFKYALKIFFVYTIAALLVFAINIATYDSQLHSFIYPILSLVIFTALFFVTPAIVIDEMDTFQAIAVSIKMIIQKWKLVVAWAILGLLSLSLVEIVLFFILPYDIAKYVIMAFNGLVIIPLFTIFQTQAYMEKYPLSP